MCTQRGKAIRELIQVSYSVTDKKTFKREVDALVRVSNLLKCDKLTLVTLDESSETEQDGKKIDRVNAIEWLLS